MNKKIIIIPLVLIIVVIGFLFNQVDERKSNIVFHVTLADPHLYKNGIYSDTFNVSKGNYQCIIDINKEADIYINSQKL